MLSFPFLYNEHGTPYDYHRFTVHRAKRLLPGFEIIHLEKQGGIGSTTVILLLNWMDMSMNSTFVTRLLKGLSLPLWVPVSFVLNLLGLVVDEIDRTGAFYNNIFVLIRKPTF